MPSNTVAQFAVELKMPANVLLEQLRAAGVEINSVDDPVTDADKAKLLESLRRAHGASDNHKITLTRRQTSEIRQADGSGRSRTIPVEVRKKRVFVKRDTTELAAEAARAAAKPAAAPAPSEAPAEAPVAQAPAQAATPPAEQPETAAPEKQAEPAAPVAEPEPVQAEAEPERPAADPESLPEAVEAPASEPEVPAAAQVEPAPTAAPEAAAPKATRAVAKSEDKP